MNVRSPGGSNRATRLWKMMAKGRGDEHHDPASEQKVNRNVVLWNKHSPALALVEALQRVEVWGRSSLFKGQDGADIDR